MNVSPRPLRFVLVGCAAAAVHWVVAVLLVEGAGVLPMAANVAGWLCAFSVSFAGHRRWTFGDWQAAVIGAAMRFFLLSAGGFMLNALAYAALLHWSGLRYDFALAGVLAAVALLTYLASHWAFRAA